MRLRGRFDDASVGRFREYVGQLTMGTAPPAGFEPPPYPYDRLDELRKEAEKVARRGRRPVDRHALRPAARRRRRGARVVRRRARLPAVGRLAGVPRGGRRLARPPVRRRSSTRSTWRPAWAPRSSWPAFRTGCACARPAATPSCTREISYPSYAMGATLAGCRAVPYATLADVDPGDAAPGAVPVGQLARQPDRRARRPGRRRGLGARRTGVPVLSDECYIEFTWRGPGPHDRRPRASTGVHRGPLAVQALEPRRRPGRVLRRRPRPGALPVRGPQARRLHGPRAGAGRRRWPPSATTPTSTTSGSATGAA